MLRIDLDISDNVSPTDVYAHPRLTREELLSKERYEEYLILLRKLNSGKMISRNKGAGLISLTYTFRSSDRDSDGQFDYSEKEFVYSSQPIWSLKESLDWGETGYKQINDNWYLYYEEGIGKPE